VFEWDGRRTEIPRVDEFEPFLYQPPPDQVPAAYRRAKGVHVLREAESLPGWRTVFPDAVLLWEPPQEHMIPEMADDFRAAISQVDIVSPNWLEAQHVYGFGDPAKLIRAMLDDGAGILALRMGEQGSIVGQRGETSCLTVPPIPVPEIVDQTGAGNTYCGGFLVGWVETGDLLKAACYGVVAASFSLEVIGVADPPANLADLRYGRYAWLAEQVAVSGC
jgi:sugar/nucleoside kinase (ribokinase family)